MIVPDQVLITRFAYPLKSVAIHDAITNFLRQKRSRNKSKKRPKALHQVFALSPLAVLEASAPLLSATPLIW